MGILYQKLEGLERKKLLLIALAVAIVGVAAGFAGGQILKSGFGTAQPSTPSSKTQVLPNVASFSGKLFAASSADYSHKLVNEKGDTVVFLKSSDDKLKVVLETTLVKVEGSVVGQEGEIPIVAVTKISF